MFGVGLLFGVNTYALCFQLRTLRGSGLVGAVAQKCSFERRLEQCVEADDVMSVAGDRQHEGDAALRCEDEMLACAVEVLLQ